MSTDQIEGFRSCILERKPVRLKGGGSKDFYGGPLSGEVLDTRGHQGIVNYEPTELVISARCGTPLAELESALAARRLDRIELCAEELRLAQEALSRITGEFTADDLLGEIFSRFCIGK